MGPIGPVGESGRIITVPRRSFSAQLCFSVVASEMKNLADQYGLELAFVSPELIVEAMENGSKLKEFGARELERVVDELLAEPMLLANNAGAAKIAVRAEEDGALRVDPV